MQQRYGGKTPYMSTDHSESITDPQAKTEWLYTVWEWAQENGIRMTHQGDTDTPKRENDIRLMDAAQNMIDKQNINKQLTKYKWASEITDETGSKLDPSKTSDMTLEWRNAAERIFKQQNIALGKWYYQTDAKTRHTERLIEHQYAASNNYVKRNTSPTSQLR